MSGILFDEVHGAGWRLVTDRSAEPVLPGALADWFGSIGGAVVDLGDTAPALSAWFAEHGVRWALQRPDFHLYGTAEDVAGASDLVDHLRHRLAGASTADTPNDLERRP